MASQSNNPFLRHPIVCLILTLLASIPLLLRLPAFALSSEADALLEGDQRNLSSYEKVREILVGVEVIVISMECNEVFSPEGIDAIRRVSDAFESQAGVEDVKSLTHSSKPVRRGLAFEMVPLAPREKVTPGELANLKEFSLQHPLIRDVMVARDSRHTLITVTYRRPLSQAQAQRRLRAEVEDILEPFRGEGLRFRILGLPLIEEEIRSTLKFDLVLFVPAATFLVVLILWLVFRSWWMLALIVLNQLAAMAALTGTIQWLGFSINVFSAMLFPLIAGIHLTLLAHLFTAYEQAARACSTAEDALASALGEVFKASAFAAITTTAGLASLLASDVPQIRAFGIMGTLGIGIIFAFTFGPGVAALVLVARKRFSQIEHAALREDAASRPPSGQTTAEGFPTRRPVRSPPHRDGPMAEWLTNFVAANRWLILSSALVVSAIASFGLARIRTDIRAVEFLSPNSAARGAVEELDRVYGGINVVQIELNSGKTNGVNELTFLRYVEQVQKHASSHPEISGAYSYAQLLAMMNQIWEGNRPEALMLPANPLVISLFVIALKAQNFPFLTALADPAYRTAYVVLRTRDMPADRYLKVLSEVVQYAETHKPPGVAVSAAKGIHSILEADRRILRSQISSAGLTLASIGLVLALLWRSIRMAAFSLITNLIAVACILALAGYAGVPLNSVTVMVAAIALGIAVDDSIHLTTHWMEARRNGQTTREALRESFRVKLRPIVLTSVILIALFSVFGLSSFPPIVHFGLLSAASFATALLAVLFLLPALLLSALSREGNCKFENPKSKSER